MVASSGIAGSSLAHGGSYGGRGEAKTCKYQNDGNDDAAIGIEQIGSHEIRNCESTVQ
jgi:hypothetical protein